MDTMQIKWLFFDVGGTLVNEKDAFDRRIRETIRIQKAHGNAYTVQQLEHAMCEAAMAGRSYFRGAMKDLGISDFAPYDAVGEILYPEAPSVLMSLSPKYKLGVIANQPEGTEKRLAQYGVRSCFSLILSSTEEGLEKPDPALFLRALEKAGCHPSQAVMIGDRPDNDIRPAKLLGMKTIRIKQGMGGMMPVTHEDMCADHTILNLNELIKIL